MRSTPQHRRLVLKAIYDTAINSDFSHDDIDAACDDIDAAVLKCADDLFSAREINHDEHRALIMYASGVLGGLLRHYDCNTWAKRLGELIDD